RPLPGRHSSPCFDPATSPPEICPLSLHDALPISPAFTIGIYLSSADLGPRVGVATITGLAATRSVTVRVSATIPPNAEAGPNALDRKSTRLNSSHSQSSYAVFCLQKKQPWSRCSG